MNFDKPYNYSSLPLPHKAKHAVELLDKHKGSLRSNSKEYLSYVQKIEQAEDPWAAATRILNRLDNKVDSKHDEVFKGMFNRHYDRKKTATCSYLSTKATDELMAYLRRGFNGIIDNAHWKLVNAFEEDYIFGDKKPTLEKWLKLCRTLIQIEAYNTRTLKWHSFRG